MWHDIEKLELLGKQEIIKLQSQTKLFASEQDQAIDKAFRQLRNSSIRTLSPELVFRRIYDYIVFNQIQEDLFRHLLI